MHEQNFLRLLNCFIKTQIKFSVQLHSFTLAVCLLVNFISISIFKENSKENSENYLNGDKILTTNVYCYKKFL